MGKPKTRPYGVGLSEESLTIRLPAKMMQELEAAAQKQGASLSSVVRDIIQQAIEAP